MSDLISRQDAIDALAELQGKASTKAELKGISKVWKRIKKLPSAQPERKTGRWLYDEERCATGIYAICSACDESIYQTGNFRYCPNCGARMMEGEG